MFYEGFSFTSLRLILSHFNLSHQHPPNKNNLPKIQSFRVARILQKNEKN